MLKEIVSQYLWIAVGVSLVLSILSIILALVSISSLSKIRKQNRRWKSIHSSADLEAVYEQTVLAVHKTEEEMKKLQKQMEFIEEGLHKKISTPRMVRYNAFGDLGNDLSYSVAFLDDEQNGVVISSIYGREESHTYGKPIQEGESQYTLTQEEKMVIQQVAAELSSDLRKPETVSR
ncbi:DUF4446 family protein [Alicyclobacillus tolerans]|uniref:DUF4446 domain-containing protein n=1 Tax=Alicyclobacillus tolerans TaxID=90970 RepID=A0A1M6T328_9BACL|nr:DUF4446 family protein [Alicyclobacillus montanus]SHK51402.1 Protein of unknown function [Alicyclobacillus montanus]